MIINVYVKFTQCLSSCYVTESRVRTRFPDIQFYEETSLYHIPKIQNTIRNQMFFN